MKYLTFFFIIGISINTLAQSSENSQPNRFFKIQGGLVYDAQTSKDYVGFNYLNLGVSRLNNEKIDGMELELMAFDQIIQEASGFIITPTGVMPTGNPEDWNCKRKTIELSAFRMFAIFGDVKNGVYLGPFISGRYMNTQLKPVDENLALFPNRSNDVGLGLGGKLDYYAHLTSKMYLTLGLKFNLMLFDLNNTITPNPALTRRQQKQGGFDFGLLEGKVPVMIGFSFCI